MKFIVTTEIEGDKIKQKLWQEYGDIQKNIMTWIIDTREESVREALLRLGWKPPK